MSIMFSCSGLCSCSGPFSCSGPNCDIKKSWRFPCYSTEFSEVTIRAIASFSTEPRTITSYSWEFSQVWWYEFNIKYSLNIQILLLYKYYMMLWWNKIKLYPVGNEPRPPMVASRHFNNNPIETLIYCSLRFDKNCSLLHHKKLGRFPGWTWTIVTIPRLNLGQYPSWAWEKYLQLQGKQSWDKIQL